MKGPEGLGEGSVLQNFQLLIPLVSAQKPGKPAPHLPAGAPRPLGKRPQPARRSPHVEPGCRLPRANGTALSVLYQRRLAFPLLARRGRPPTFGFRSVEGEMNADPLSSSNSALSMNLTVSKSPWTVEASAPPPPQSF